MDIGLQQGRGGAIWLYAGTEDVADEGEHGYRRIERTYAPWQGRRDAIWLYAGTEGVADEGEHGYRRIERTYAPWQGRRDAIWLYAGTEGVADDGEHGYRRAERTYAPGGMRYGPTPVQRTSRTAESMDIGVQRGRTRCGRSGGMRYSSTL